MRICFLLLVSLLLSCAENNEPRPFKLRNRGILIQSVSTAGVYVIRDVWSGNKTSWVRPGTEVMLKGTAKPPTIQMSDILAYRVAPEPEPAPVKDAGVDVPFDQAVAQADAPSSSSGTHSRKYLKGLFPQNDPWNTDISDYPLHPQHEEFIAAMWPAKRLRAEFSSGLWMGAQGGMPYSVVPHDQPLVKIWIQVLEGWEKEATEYNGSGSPDYAVAPVPPDTKLEAPYWEGSDRHALILQNDAQGRPALLFEFWRMSKREDGQWQAQHMSYFDVRLPSLQRAMPSTSSDAAGFPILQALIMYEAVEAAMAEENPEDRHLGHAVRFTVPYTSRRFVLPATHWATTDPNPSYAPMGLRVRLKKDFDIDAVAPNWLKNDWASGAFSKERCLVYVRTFKKYGMFLADNGGGGTDWFVGGVPDDRWNDDATRSCFDTMHGYDFEVIAGPSGYKPELNGKVYSGWEGYKEAAADLEGRVLRP